MTTTERIDWLAIEWVCYGKRLPLTSEEQRIVVRQMSDKLLSNGELAQYLPPGKVLLRTLAERLGVSVRHIERLRHDMVPATKRRCPTCKGDAWVTESGLVEDHADGFYDLCAQSGKTL